MDDITEETFSRVMERQDRLEDIIAAQHGRMTSMQLVIDELRSEVNLLRAWKASYRSLKEEGLPSFDQMSRLEVQVFHTPKLRDEPEQDKSEWSLKLHPWTGGYKLGGANGKGIDIQLKSCTEFATCTSKIANLSDIIAEWVQDHPEDDPDTLAGMIRLQPYGSGRPYKRDQCCVLRDHTLGLPNVSVTVLIGDRFERITNFRIAKGSKATKAKWYGQWKP